jgi:hypothetical protein
MNAQPLWYWMAERHKIYLKKRDGAEPPWTKDPILQQYRFCNVFRELDTVTVWIRENIREQYPNSKNLWFMLAIARTINWPPTIMKIMEAGLWNRDTWEWQAVADLLDEQMALGKKVYTGAYMIRAESDPGNKWYNKSKQEYIAGCVLGNLWRDRDAISATLEHVKPDQAKWAFDFERTLQGIHSMFMSYHGWGPFMAYELVTDLRHTRYLEHATDIFTWANAGPGALRGLNRLREVDPQTPMTQQEANTRMYDLLLEAHRHPELAFHFELEGALEMRDIEHSLCETDKYLRVKNGEGRPRAKYVRGRGY